MSVQMPFQTTSEIKPKKGSLIVCAGTLTCTTVSSMGSGFLVFKNFFKRNYHHENQLNGWQTALQDILNKYHRQESPMPPYVRIAKQGSYIGGIATVPAKSGNIGLTFKKMTDALEREQDFQEQYKAAIRLAILDAKTLGRPLFLQPLGIGVYGWDAKIAAELFAQVICEVDPKDEVEITIPIFKPTLGSKNNLFKQTLIAEMAKKGRSPMKKEALLYEAELNLNTLPIHTKNLVTIVDQLIETITTKRKKQDASSINTQQLRLLNEIKDTIIFENKEIIRGSETEQHLLKEIRSACEIKPHFIHFWSVSEAVIEFKRLLADKGIDLPEERSIPKSTLI